MVVPMLEEDEADVAEQSHDWGAAPVYEAPAVQEPEQVDARDGYAPPAPFAEPQEQAAPQSYGVEQVSLDEGSAFLEPTHQVEPPYEAEPTAPVQPAYEAPVTPQWQTDAQPAPAVAAPPLTPAELAALTATPSMDELMAGEDDDKPNFFSRLFGRGKKEDDSPAPAQSAPAPFAGMPATAPVPASRHFGADSFTPIAPNDALAPEAVAPVEAPIPVEATPPAPEPVQPQEPAEAPYPAGVFTPQVSLHQAPPANETPWYQHGASSTPTAEPQELAPTEPESVPEPAEPAHGAAHFFSARKPEGSHAGQFTPDDLASPVGWEAAGASALQAAAPDVQTSYSPKVDLDTGAGAGVDLSSVFSEFSSLSSSRPKVEKTRAGLQKRRGADAPAVVVKPIEDEVVVAPRERDADAVRSRFSSFYSGTQRARSDAAEFERSRATPESKE
jgi:hypothetical protein